MTDMVDEGTGMDRRQFLKTTALVAGGWKLGCTAPILHRGNVPTKHWISIAAGLQATDDEWRRRFSHWRFHGLDVIVPEVFNSWEAFYGSGHLPVKEPWLERIMPLAKAEGLEVHA